MRNLVAPSTNELGVLISFSLFCLCVDIVCLDEVINSLLLFFSL